MTRHRSSSRRWWHYWTQRRNREAVARRNVATLARINALALPPFDGTEHDGRIVAGTDWQR